MSRTVPLIFSLALVAALSVPPPVHAGDTTLRSSSLRSTSWPMLQGNPARTGYTDDTVQLPAKVLWQYDAKEEQVSRHVQTIISEGRAYLPTHAGNLHCVNADIGKLILNVRVRKTLP